MPVSLQIVAVVVGILLWPLGLAVFLRSELSGRRKIIWTGVLITVGLAIGALLPAPSIVRKFIAMIIALPVFAVVDLAFLKPRRTLSFWIRACGYEVCTVFGVAWVARALIDLLL
jgi:hypothetical protein